MKSISGEHGALLFHDHLFWNLFAQTFLRCLSQPALCGGSATHLSEPDTQWEAKGNTPLRTVRESFPSHGSGLSKDAPMRGIPAIGWTNVSILSPLYARED